VKGKTIGLGFVFLLVLLIFGSASADKSAVSLEGPATAAKGTEVTIKITVTHSANSALHYTEWLKVTADNKELGKWNFTSGQRPEAAVFTREVKFKVLEDTEIRAEASCNVHGSKGPGTLKISVK
jgi:desulfoferrodoxin (superoxide reductase-like protein)